MSAGTQEPMGGIEPAHIALDEFRATQDECSEFFGDVFDRFHTLSLELFARHKGLEAGAEINEIREGFRQIAGEFAGIKEELKQMRSLLESK